jgi:hypothetical protein
MKIQLPSSQTESIISNLFTTVWYTFFNSTWKRILGKFDVYFGGVLENNTTSIGSIGASSDLMSYTLSKNSLITTGDYIDINAFGTFASNANNKTISLVFGSTTIYTIGATAINSGSWDLKARIIRTGSATQEIMVDANGTNAVLIKTKYTAGTEDLTTDLTIKVSATGVADNDVVQKNLTIKIYSQ